MTVAVELPSPTPAGLTWEATEFGRRTACHRFRIIHRDGGWQLVDDDWSRIGEPTRTILAAQLCADHLVRAEQRRADREAQ